ncbi:hypothetical protein RGQ29_007596 [Quercus rubra]|uniref:Phosphatidic acid phosphatase type 2/haloperoxidase domain-containing protein n=1 Tax=Quercus rubra TaxID=3512 RepID=A0AAN7I7A4_QUERU|nr:hypothetical protein RGQ29_007596 [Quercus rubra]KAK4557910.1 hypothetical protein RGQ29_007596 [Quercus rubra]KAK4557911.1 hypothetical protein RGQ29_007596 [Quercus rubra]KAK4557912.1 hypothetical protein RGQ29_007596 [Quercus rubra]KAK4557913.1 hypothetical protein RGQ29_007596 [Quercus rubra]
MDPPQPPKAATTTTTAAAATTTGSTTFLSHLISVDTTLSKYLHSTLEPFLPHFLLFLLELSADFRLFFPISLSLLLAPNSSTSLFLLRRPFLSSLLLGLLLDLGLIALIKLLFRRSRPVYNKNMIAAVSVDHYSFPSGHASRVFFVASIAYFFADDEANLLNLVVWLWAVLTSLSRVFLGRHFVFDVFAGASLGVLEALFAFRFLRFYL